MYVSGVALESLLTAYHDLNASLVDELSEEPSALEFMRYVAKNRPFVVRGAATSWSAVRKWDARYLNQAMRGKSVNVAVTPCGNADAVVKQSDGSLLFVEPCETTELFEDFLQYVQQDRSQASSRPSRPRNVKYAQTQNDNLRAEYLNLFPDVLPDISFARIALARKAEAINLWIGNERSVTALHKDNYENIYVQVRGEKHFVLLSPVEMACVNERLLRKGRYAPCDGGGEGEGEELVIEREDGDGGDDDDGRIPVAIWDPDLPEERATAYSHLAHPLRVTLREGDMLYLPAMWYHKVSQTSGDEGFACAVNYWYDMDWDGAFWTCNNFIRDIYKNEYMTEGTKQHS